MNRTFSVSIPPEARTARADATGRAALSYTVSNNKPSPVRGRVRIVAKDSAQEEWFRVDGDSERDFRVDEIHQFTIRAAIPADIPAGTYSFRLDASNVANPQEDFTEGDTIALEWKPTPKQHPSAVSWWPIAAAALLVAAIGFAVFVFWPSPKSEPETQVEITTVEIPPVAGEPLLFAIAKLYSEGLEVDREFDDEFVTTVEEDTVFQSIPSQGEKVEKGYKVKLVVHRKGASVPRVTSADPTAADATTAEVATQTLDSSNFKVQLHYERRVDAVKPGVVLEQIPPADSIVEPGSAVKLVVQAAPDPVPVPRELVGMTYEAAVEHLRWKNLASTLKIELSGTGQLGKVVKVEPAPGTLVEPGKAVTLTVKGVEVPPFSGRSIGEYIVDLGNHRLVPKLPPRVAHTAMVVRTHPRVGATLLPGAEVAINDLFDSPFYDLYRKPIDYDVLRKLAPKHSPPPR